MFMNQKSLSILLKYQSYTNWSIDLVQFQPKSQQTFEKTDKPIKHLQKT
jgi:hypothetical protein